MSIFYASVFLLKLEAMVKTDGEVSRSDLNPEFNFSCRQKNPTEIIIYNELKGKENRLGTYFEQIFW